MDLEFNRDDDLSVVWHRFVEKLPGVKGTSHEGSFDIDSATAKIAMMIPQENAAAKKTRLRFQTSLQCIKVLGGVVAEGSRVAFGPAKTCFSTFTLVIEAVQRANQSFEDLDVLLDCMCGFLRTLKTNLQIRAQEQTSRPLRLVCFEILREFLWVLSRVLELTTSGTKRFKHLARTVFTGDNAVRGALGKMANLIEDVLRTAIADILAKVNTGAKDFAKVQKDVETVVEHQRLQEIHEALNLGSDNSDKLNKERHNQVSSKTVAGTGDWILGMEYFQCWSDVSKPTPHPILCIGEMAHAGKTFLSNRIIRHLKAKCNNYSVNKIAAAYYYFSEKIHEMFSKDGMNAQSRALRTIVWQLANTDSGSAHHFNHLLNHRTDLSLSALWKSILQYSGSTSTVVFIVLDGCWAPSSETQVFFERVITDVSSTKPSKAFPPQVRLNLSGRHRFFELLGRFPYKFNHPSWVPFAGEGIRHNAPDIRLIIDDRLSKKGFPPEPCERIKRTMVDHLINTELFPRLQSFLSAMENELYPSRIDALLERVRVESRDC